VKIATMSFDDGHMKDFNAACILGANECQATFYVTAGRLEPPRMEEYYGVLGLDRIREGYTGMEIGGHGVAHYILVERPETLELETVTARRRLETVFGRPIESFAYPYGIRDKRTIAAVRAAGYTHARTYDVDPGNVVNANRYEHAVTLKFAPSMLDTLRRCIDAGHEHIHVAGHAWQFSSDDWEIFKRMVEALLVANYPITSNGSFWRLASGEAGR